MRNEAASFLLAVQFLTRLPISSSGLYSPERMAAAVRYYPLVGILVGGMSSITFLCANIALPQVIAVLLAIATGLLITGAFHEDGLADTFDGIGGGHAREQALAIMKDSRLGTYGTTALVLVLGLKATALAALPSELIVAGLIAGHGFSRLSSVLVIATSRYVRDEGTAKPVSGGISIFGLIVALLIAGAMISAWCLFQQPAALAWAGGGLIVGHVAMRLFFERKLGGYTGDTLGAVQQVSEIGFYLGLVAWL
ncbi:MAG: adenosylcobinamide-GDP ribazoletransferase [Pseudomonadota bacterium]